MGQQQPSLHSQLDAVEARLAEAAVRIADLEAMADMGRYVALSRDYKALERTALAGRAWLRLLNEAAEAEAMLADPDTDPGLLDLAREQLAMAREALPEAEKTLRLLLTPADPADAKNAILEIRAGTGGDEAALFAGDLFRMYSRFCASKGWAIAVTSASEGAAGGFKEIVASVTAPAAADEGVYGLLKFEGGVHRVQRVPATETQGRVHTSAATVAVLPEADPFEVEVDNSAIDWDTFRSSGAGGQNVNKVESGVRLRYRTTSPDTGQPEEILIECTETRDQPRNKERALARLRAMLYDRELRRRREREEGLRRSIVSTGDRSAKIRTYNFPQGRVTDHRINFTSHDLPAILDGALTPLLEALRLAEAEKIADQDNTPQA